MGRLSAAHLFPIPPRIDFRPALTHCPSCQRPLTILKTHARGVNTLLVGPFRAVETVLTCPACRRHYRTEELSRLVPPGARFGYDVLVYVGRALFLRYRNEEEVVAELAERQVRISPSEVSLLGRKFITYLALAHQRCSPRIQEGMKRRGGYVLHLDATTEGGSPMLMSSLDSLSHIVLGNVKLPSEAEALIVPFLRRFKETFGTPLASVHDMGSGILKAVATVFPGVPDFICHFHFLRDIGKDLLGEDYDLIRQRLRKRQIHAELNTHAQAFKRRLQPCDLAPLPDRLPDQGPFGSDRALSPTLGAYTLILWTLDGKRQGDGYGFPFDQPHLAFAQRIRRLYGQLNSIRERALPGHWRDNLPYFDLLNGLNPVIEDRHLWPAVERLEANLLIFERLRQALRIAPKAAGDGLNDEGLADTIQSIEARVKAFRSSLTACPDYPQSPNVAGLVAQLDKYWAKLFADPIAASTPSGPVVIQPQRTNNILEQFFRHLKRAHRRRTGQASASRMLRTMLAETPLVKNLQNPAYLPALLNGKATLEEVFADIDISLVRQELRLVQQDAGPLPTRLKHLIATPDYPDKLLTTLRTAAI